MASLRALNPRHGKMPDLAGIPSGGRGRDRQAWERVLEFLESAVAIDVDAAGGRIDRRDSNPPVLDQLPERRARVHDVHEAFRSRLDDEENAHGLVNLDHLPGQAGAQVAGMAVHHTDEARHVVRQFRAAAVAIVIDERKVILEADAGAYGYHGGEQGGEALVIGILVRVVGGQECTAIEEEAAGEAAASHDADGIGAMAVLRPRFGQMLAAFLDVAQRLLGRSAGGQDSKRRARSWALRARARSRDSRTRSRSG